MSVRGSLSEEAEREEAEYRDHRRALETKFRDLRTRRELLLAQVHQLVDDQKLLFDRQAPKQQTLEELHEDYRAIGHDLADLRHQRDKVRNELEGTLQELRYARSELPRGDRPRPDQLEREVRQLELKQQTTALPLTEENALIDRMRALRRQLDGVQKEASVVDAHESRVKTLEKSVAGKRTELEKLMAESARLKVERDRRMANMRSLLEEVGALVGEIRAKARARRDTMDKVQGFSRQLGEIDDEILRLDRGSRARRDEARRTIREYSRGSRDRVAVETAYASVADQQLEQLLKRGRITLGG
ncbi:MAG: hypothetical protein L3J87_02505 [Thermoplasmata archaeon]|nr:hypothetical protein [Thermoplasmata archaeon]MCI4344482.1 hypothetical protein [Thermoplasmata archaeon]